MSENEFLIDIHEDEQYRIYEKLTNLLEGFKTQNKIQACELAASLVLDMFDMREKK